MLELIVDFSNILGGLLLATGLLSAIPAARPSIEKFSGALSPFTIIIAIVALISGGYFLIVHIFSGPHIFHFEVVAIATGLLLLFRGVQSRPVRTEATSASANTPAFWIGIFGVIAILTGIQGAGDAQLAGNGLSRR